MIGLCTALIFGLLPIVQAATIRPLSVIRELSGSHHAGNILLTFLLLVILSGLFCGMAVFILKDVFWGIGAVYGAFVFLLVLSLCFSLVVLIIGKLPVPERLSSRYVLLVTGGVLISTLLLFVLPAFGSLLLGVTLLGYVVVFLPRSWKVNTKLALRNVGRQRARTTTTLLALFIGVFALGLILVLGQDVMPSR